MTSNNVVSFPKKHPNPQSPQTIEEIEDNMELVKQFHIQETIETIMPKFFDQLSIAGFEPAEDDGDIKDGAFVIEALRSLLLKSYGIHHPFQEMCKNIFEEDEEGILTLSDLVKIVVTSEDGG
jgi:hypothetical protein